MEMAIGIHSSLSVSLSITPNPSTMLAAPTALLPKQLLGRTLSTISSTKRLSNPNSRVARLLPTSVQCSVSEATESSTSKKSGMLRRGDIRNIAIVAHVDHGKTTLVDSMLKQAKVVHDDQAVQERIMDSNDLEKERGITILSKITSITYKNTKINIIDTPGDSGYGGEVERILNMVEGILLVVDSVEGPMPQTRFVIKKALEFGHAVIVVVNKIDRPSARPDYVISSTFELFIELNATDEQCDFQVIYASGINGKAGLSPQKLADDLGPLFESVIRCIPGPRISKDDNLQMLATNIEYEEHKGRIAIGRLHAGVLKRGMDVRVCTTDDSCRSARVSELFVYENFYRVPVESVEAGEICAVCGISDIQDPMDVIELSDDSRMSLDACLSVSNITSLCEGYYNSNNDGDSFVDLSFHSRSSTSTAAVSPPPKQPPPPRQGGDEGGNDDSDNDDNNNKYDFQAKALFLDSIGIDPLSVLSRDPSALASASLLELKQLFGYLSSLGLSPSDLRRMASMHPAVLSLRLRDAASVCSFLIREAHVAPSGLRRALHRRPRLLLSPVSSRLRPTLYFLQSLGIHDVARHTDLLSCSVEDKFLPRIEYFQRLGFSYRDSVSMFRRFPPLFCYSIRDNFEPKFNYFVVDMGRELKELREFPQYFSFSLDKRIKPRHQMCVHKGVYFPLNVMLKTTEEEFQRRLGVSVDSSLPVRDSPLWCTNLSFDVNATLQLGDDDDDNIL